jgi:hypothetical protein
MGRRKDNQPEKGNKRIRSAEDGEDANRPKHPKVPKQGSVVVASNEASSTNTRNVPVMHRYVLLLCRYCTLVPVLCWYRHCISTGTVLVPVQYYYQYYVLRASLLTTLACWYYR